MKKLMVKGNDPPLIKGLIDNYDETTKAFKAQKVVENDSSQCKRKIPAS